MNLASCDLSESRTACAADIPSAQSSDGKRAEVVHSQRRFEAMLRDLSTEATATTGVEELPAGRSPPGLDAGWSADERKAGTRTLDLEEWERCLREREADLKLREEATARRRPDRARQPGSPRSASGAIDEHPLAAPTAPVYQGSELSRRFHIMSQLLTELRKSQTVALDEARGASAGGFGPIRGGAEIDVDAVRLALEALHDGLETERQRLAQEAARTQAGKGSFELDRQNLDELMEALRHEQEQQEHRRMQRKPELPVDEFVLADDPLLDNAGEQQTFQEQETVVMSNSSRAAEAATEAELSAASTVTAACCTPNCPVDTPDDGTDENLLAAVEAPHDEQRAEMESLRVVANDSARRAIRRHSWKQRLSAYGMVLALSSASAILMLWAWGGLAAGTVSSLAWGAGAVSLIASLSFGFDARRKNRIRKSLARRV